MWLKNGRSNLWRGQDRSSPYFCFPFLHGCISSQGKHGFFAVKIWNYTSKTLPAEVLSSCPKADWNCSRWMVSSWCFPHGQVGWLWTWRSETWVSRFLGANSCIEAIKVEVPTADLKELLAALTEVSFDLAVSSNQKLKKTDCEKRLTTSFWNWVMWYSFQ